MTLVASPEALRPAGSEGSLRAAGDYYALRRQQEEIVAAESTDDEDGPAAESSVVPGAASGIDITDRPVDVSGAPRPRKPRYLPDLTVQRVREAHLSDFEDSPAEAMGDDDWLPRMLVASTSLETILSTGDVDRCLAYAQLKVADAFCHGVEHTLVGTERYGLKLKAEIAVAEESFDGTEISLQVIRQLKERQRMARMQWRWLNRLFDRLLQTRNEWVGRSGIDFDAYRSVRDMSAGRERQRRDLQLIARYEGMSREDWEREKGRIRDVKLAHDGVDALALMPGLTHVDVAKHRQKVAEIARHELVQQGFSIVRRKRPRRVRAATADAG